MMRLTEISLYWAYSPLTEPSELSKINSTEAEPTGLRELEPLKITSVIEPPRSIFAEVSPITQRTASMIFDLPHPFGPTTPIRLDGIRNSVESTNDLNPANFIFDNRIEACYSFVNCLRCTFFKNGTLCHEYITKQRIRNIC